MQPRLRKLQASSNCGNAETEFERGRSAAAIQTQLQHGARPCNRRPPHTVQVPLATWLETILFIISFAA